MKNVVKLSAKDLVKLEGIEKFVPVPKNLKALGFSSPKDFKAAVLSGKDGMPKYFVFDTPSLWDFLCAIDEKYEEEVPVETYMTKNPVGWLIDAIEAKLPLNPKLIARLKKGIKEAKNSGLVPFEKIKLKLGLA